MEKFSRLTGVAAPLPMVNVDTDMIIPKQFLKTIARHGLAKGLFHDHRFEHDGTPRAGFVLDHPHYREAQILVTGANFGCGSSREHAPWALLDFGIRCIIAPSFADIFHNNCFKNGILPVALAQQHVDVFMEVAHRGANARITVDLHEQTLAGPDGEAVAFDIDPFRKHCLIHGLDDIGLTLEKGHHLDGFETGQRESHPWLHR